MKPSKTMPPRPGSGTGVRARPSPAADQPAAREVECHRHHYLRGCPVPTSTSQHAIRAARHATPDDSVASIPTATPGPRPSASAYIADHPRRRRRSRNPAREMRCRSTSSMPRSRRQASKVSDITRYSQEASVSASAGELPDDPSGEIGSGFGVFRFPVSLRTTTSWPAAPEPRPVEARLPATPVATGCLLRGPPAPAP